MEQLTITEAYLLGMLNEHGETKNKAKTNIFLIVSALADLVELKIISIDEHAALHVLKDLPQELAMYQEIFDEVMLSENENRNFTDTIQLFVLNSIVTKKSNTFYKTVISQLELKQIIKKSTIPVMFGMGEKAVYHPEDSVIAELKTDFLNQIIENDSYESYYVILSLLFEASRRLKKIAGDRYLFIKEKTLSHVHNEDTDNYQLVQAVNDFLTEQEKQEAYDLFL